MQWLVPVLVVVVPLLALAALSLARLDELFVLRVEGGRVELVRGRISPALLAELREVVGRFPDARGALRSRHRHPSPTLEADGLPEPLVQGARSVFALHAATLLRHATLEARTKPVRSWIAAGVAVAGFVVLVLSLPSGPSRGSIRFRSHDLRGDDMEAEGLASAFGPEVQSDVMEGREAQARPFLEQLQRTGVFDPRLPRFNTLMSGAGPGYAMLGSARAVVIPSSGRQAASGEQTARDLDSMFDRLGLPQVTAHCDATMGCWLVDGATIVPLVVPSEATAREGVDPCETRRIADRLGTFLKTIGDAHVPPWTLLLASNPFVLPDDGITDEHIAFVLVTEEERRILDAWQHVDLGSDSGRFGRRYPDEVAADPACREAPADRGTSP